MAESGDISLTTSEYSFVCSPPDETCESQLTHPAPTPTPRTPRQEGAGESQLASASDQLLLLDALYEEQERACSYTEYAQVLKFCDEKERKDINIMQSLPQLMKNTLFFQNEDMLTSSQERVKAKAANEEEFKKFIKHLKTASNQPNDNLREKATILLEILNNAHLIASNGETSLKSSNEIFKKISQVFQETIGFMGHHPEVSPDPMELLREASEDSKQRQIHLQAGNLDAAEECLKQAMDKIEVSVARAEIQNESADKIYMEVACKNRHIAIQGMEGEIAEALGTERNGINLLETHCCEDQQRIERAANTLERVFSQSREHSQQLDELQKRELAKNKEEQEKLELKLKELRESAKRIDSQRTHAKRQDKSADKAYKDSKEKVTQWRQQIDRLQAQTQHACNVLNLVEESSGMVIRDFFQEHQLYLAELNRVAVESLKLYRQCLVGRIVACRFRFQELETNISSLSYLLEPKKEELKKQRRTGLKVMADKTEREVKELGEYKHSYMLARLSVESVLQGANEKLQVVDAAIVKKCPGDNLQSVDAIYALEREQLDAAWDNLEMQSLTKAYS